MARITAHSGVLLSSDVTASMHHWRDVLGFAIVNTYGDPPGFAILRRDDAYMMLGLTEAPVVPRRTQRESLFDAYFWVDDARAEFEQLRARNARVDYEPCLMPYGVLEFGILDADDHLVGFGQVMDARYSEKNPLSEIGPHA